MIPLLGKGKKGMPGAGNRKPETGRGAPAKPNEANKGNNHEILSEEERQKRKKKEELWEKRKYIVQAHVIDIETGRNIVVLNEDEALENDIRQGYRVDLKTTGGEKVCIVDLSREMVKKGEIGVFGDVAHKLQIEEGDILQVVKMERPASVEFIKKKLDGEGLESSQIHTIIHDLMDNRLSEAELSAWITSTYIRGMGEDEVVALTNSIVESGDHLELGAKPIADKHCIGGVAGNRTTMVLVPIIAAAGIYIPKTSSRSITSASGTADTMEVLAPVDFSVEEMKRIVLKAHGAIAWGGGMNLASADDRLIRIRNPLSLDPRGMLLASILAKKKSVGAQYVVVDIPLGRGVKIMNMEDAEALGADFIKIGKRLEMTIEGLITDGSEPVGNGIGPGLEVKDVVQVLQGGGPADLRNKSCLLAGKILELVGKVGEGDGYDAAMSLLHNGKAWGKMKEIIREQGGNPDFKESDIPMGQYKHTVKAEKEGKISHIDNKAISRIARAAGAPKNKGAGLYLHRLKGDRVKPGDLLFDIYAESESALEYAIKALEVWKPIELEKMLLGTMR
ncbi:MAG: AMP phosphorylase [Candidatus ainarchaeum sp.]|nr:AMP phosphorylase [Candidatus ainarchaeum sp.]